VTNNDLSHRLRSLFGGSPGARTRDHRIKSPFISLFITIFYNTKQHSTIRTEGTCKRLESPRSVVRYCRISAFVEFKCTRSAPWRGWCRTPSLRRGKTLQLLKPVEDDDERYRLLRRIVLVHEQEALPYLGFDPGITISSPTTMSRYVAPKVCLNASMLASQLSWGERPTTPTSRCLK